MMAVSVGSRPLDPKSIRDGSVQEVGISSIGAAEAIGFLQQVVPTEVNLNRFAHARK
jgi:hypothetical protein